MEENNKLPAGWGNAEDDEDYSFPEAENDSPWGAASSSDESPESDETEKQDHVIPSDKAEISVLQQNLSGRKKSNTPLIIGIVAAVIIAGVGGVFGGILLTKDRAIPDEQEMTAETAMTVSSETDRVSMETAAESISETEMVQPDTRVETQSTSEVPYKVYEEAAIRTLDDFLESYWLGSADAPYYLDNVMYSLIDVNEDGVPELLTSYPTEASDTSSLYLYDGGDYREYDALTWGNARVCVSAHLIELRSYEGAEVRTIYEMDAQGNISLKDEIVYGYDYEDYYTLNNEKISSVEYDEINRHYDSLRWETIDRYEYKRSGMDMSETTEPTDTVETPSFSLPQALYKPKVMDSGLIYNYPVYIEFLQDVCSIYDSKELSDIGYALYDLNADEVPELVITQNGYMMGMYTVNASSVYTLCEAVERYWYRLTSSGLIVGEGSTEASNYYYSFERFDGGSKTTHLAGLTVSYSEGGISINYYDDGYNCIEITEAQKRELLDHNTIEFESKPVTDVMESESPAQSVPTIDAWIETRTIPVDDDGDGIYEAVADGCDLYLCVSGDYDSYYFEYYMAEPDGSNPVLYDSGTISYPEIYLTSGSGGFSVIVGIIPIAADGTRGEAVYATLVL